MKQVYRIKTDPDTYQMVMTANVKEYNRLSMECLPKAEGWEPPDVYIPHPFKKAADFMSTNGRGTMIITQRAATALEDFFSVSCELLPLPCESETFMVVNVLNCVNWLSKDKTKWLYNSGVKVSPPKDYVFHSDRFSGPIGLLKIPETHKREILVWIDTEGAAADNFIGRVEYHGLTGLAFEKLWQETGKP